MAAGGCGDDTPDACELLFSISTIGIGCLVSYGKNNGVNHNKLYDC